MNELVIARYKENIDWIPETSWKVTVYNKSDGINQLPNVGREGHTYFYHIVSNYDSLADWTIFTQGAPIEHTGHNGSNALDVILRFVSIDIIPFHSGYIPLVQSCFPISFYINTLDVVNVTSSLGIDVNSVKEFFFPNGIFLVDKASILKRPKAFYENCLSLLSYSNNPHEGHCFERLWVTIFDSLPIIHNDIFKIHGAKFGHIDTWVDVTQQIKYMCAVGYGMSVKNIGWGVIDPAPGVLKKTVIEYVSNSQSCKVEVMDNEVVTIGSVV